jgi:hypothetical protein
MWALLATIACGGEGGTRNEAQGGDASPDGPALTPDGGPTPDVVQPDVVQPDVVQPDVVQPDVTADVVQPDVTASDVVQPDVTASDVVQPDVTASDVVQPDVVEQDVAPPEPDPWHDPDTGLTWQNPPSDVRMDDPVTYCATLSHDGLTDWRVPTIDELRTLVRGCSATEPSGSCNVEEAGCLALACRDATCAGCAGNAGPAKGCYWPDGLKGECASTWSSSLVEDNEPHAWHVDFTSGGVNCPVCYTFHFTRCVRP